jgi:hypothetical protein
MLQSFSYHPPLRGTYSHHLTPIYYESAVNAYNHKDYVSSIDSLIKYLTHDTHTTITDNVGKITYILPHGSIVITFTVDIEKDLVHIQAPFISISESKIIPLLRKATQLNFSPLVLSRIVLVGSDMYFDYKTILEDTDPDKLYDILREICLQADTYDDEFIHKYNATRLHTPEIIPYKDAQKEEAWQNMLLYVKEADLAIQYFESKRMNGFVWDILAILMMKLDYYLQPQGYLRKMLEDAIDHLFGDTEISMRIQYGRSFLQKLQQMEKKMFFESLYHIHILIPYKEVYGTEAFHKQLQHAFIQAQDEYKNMDYYGCVYTIQYNLYRICYKGNFDQIFSDAIRTCLSGSHNRPIDEAATLMLSDLETIMAITPQSKIPEEDKRIESKKGFFAKLFGK